LPKGYGGQTSGIVAAHSLANRFCFCSEVKRDSFGQSLHRDLLKTKAETVKTLSGTEQFDQSTGWEDL
jgi:hypothetical protein